ncbi:uncharacterized protein LOC134247947 [Saccostrea cucullata]|uniref:uncharacterized protein LOC134247947 n=1 Tax=Saccostrea cuccullata TaxID=36930 RepID=UPI002ED2BDED
MISDAGTQLVAAGKELDKFEVEWNVIKSADAPWENGCSESLIKSVNRCLQIAVGDSILTFSELQTVLFEAANLINERPIGTKVCDPNEGTYLCPNDLLLGKSTVRVPQMQMEERCNPRLRWKFIQQLVDTFWKRWIRDYFPTLIVRQKWHTSRRNLKQGDLVLVQDTNLIRGKWKLAQVAEAEPGTDGKVRDVTVRYKNVGPGAKYDGCTDTVIRRSVHRLVVILPVDECD